MVTETSPCAVCVGGGTTDWARTAAGKASAVKNSTELRINTPRNVITGTMLQLTQTPRDEQIAAPVNYG
jgi:hypothetical protein